MALAYYNAVKQGAKMNVLSAKPIYEELRKRFDKVTKEAKAETTENA
ncbi:MAG: hypothetical protein WC703_09565 [Candidatus Neomarinimicrobiota bacterium]